MDFFAEMTASFFFFYIYNTYIRYTRIEIFVKTTIFSSIIILKPFVKNCPKLPAQYNNTKMM